MATRLSKRARLELHEEGEFIENLGENSDNSADKSGIYDI